MPGPLVGAGCCGGWGQGSGVPEGSPMGPMAVVAGDSSSYICGFSVHFQFQSPARVLIAICMLLSCSSRRLLNPSCGAAIRAVRLFRTRAALFSNPPTRRHRYLGPRVVSSPARRLLTSFAAPSIEGIEMEVLGCGVGAWELAGAAGGGRLMVTCDRTFVQLRLFSGCGARPCRRCCLCYRWCSGEVATCRWRPVACCW